MACLFFVIVFQYFSTPSYTTNEREVRVRSSTRKVRNGSERYYITLCNPFAQLCKSTIDKLFSESFRDAPLHVPRVSYVSARSTVFCYRMGATVRYFFFPHTHSCRNDCATENNRSGTVSTTTANDRRTRDARPCLDIFRRDWKKKKLSSCY